MSVEVVAPARCSDAGRDQSRTRAFCRGWRYARLGVAAMAVAAAALSLIAALYVEIFDAFQADSDLLLGTSVLLGLTVVAAWALRQRDIALFGRVFAAPAVLTPVVAPVILVLIAVPLIATPTSRPDLVLTALDFLPAPALVLQQQEPDDAADLYDAVFGAADSLEAYDATFLSDEAGSPAAWWINLSARRDVAHNQALGLVLTVRAAPRAWSFLDEEDLLAAYDLDEIRTRALVLPTLGPSDRLCLELLAASFEIFGPAGRTCAPELPTRAFRPSVFRPAPDEVTWWDGPERDEVWRDFGFDLELEFDQPGEQWAWSLAPKDGVLGQQPLIVRAWLERPTGEVVSLGNLSRTVTVRKGLLDRYPGLVTSGLGLGSVLLGGTLSLIGQALRRRS